MQLYRVVRITVNLLELGNARYGKNVHLRKEKGNGQCSFLSCPPFPICFLPFNLRACIKKLREREQLSEEKWRDKKEN